MTEMIAHQILDRAITEACVNARFERYTIVIPYEEMHEYLKTGYLNMSGNLVISIEVSMENQESTNVGSN